MVFDRYNDVWVCVSPQVLKSIITTDEYAGCLWAIAVRLEEDIAELEKSMKEILSLKNSKICLWIDEKICREHEQKISKLFFLFYSTNYLFHYGNVVICLIGNHPQSHNNSRSRLEDWINSLGFIPSINEIQNWNLSGIHDGQWFLQTDNNSDIFSFYTDQLTRNFFVGLDIFIIPTDEKKIPKILETICEAEKAILKTTPKLDELFQHYRFLLKQEEKLNNENKRLEIDLSNQKKYLAVLRREKEMEKIIEFYHGEYEVLPLWYKRFGHIIKLLTGKRKIRSTHNQK